MIGLRSFAISENYLRITANLSAKNKAALPSGLDGTYISVEPFHVDAYRFKATLKDIAGRRLTYAELTGTALTPVEILRPLGSSSARN